MYVLTWSDSESKANDLLRAAMQQCKYPWAWRKLRSARWHLIETHTTRVPEKDWTTQKYVSNADAEI